MKKKAFLTMVVIFSALVFVVVRLNAGYVLEEENRESRLKDPNYQKRVTEEQAAAEKGKNEAEKRIRSLEENEKQAKNCREKVEESLRYSLKHFSHLQEGDDVDINVAAKLSYHMRFITELVYACDYEQTVHTDKEKIVGQTKIYRYIDAAYSYAIECPSHTQEKADYLKAHRLGKELERNIEEECDAFTEAITAVIEEAKEKGWIEV